MPVESQDADQKQLIRAVRLGFALVLTFTLILGGIGLYQLNSVNASMSKIVTVNNTKIELASAMRDAIRLRAMAIHKMLATTDYFRRDREILKFYEYARMFRQARDQFLTLDLDQHEKTIIDKLTKQAKITQPLVRKIAELLMDNKQPPDFNERLIDATQKQEALFGLLEQSISLQKQYANHAVVVARTKFEYTVGSLMAVLVVLLIIGAIVAGIVERYVGKKNSVLAAKNAELRKARIKADEATRAKSEFLASMSHEIRTPLTTILGFSESLMEGELTAEDHQRAMLAIRNSGRHLSDIINDVLDISKIEAGKLEVESVSVSPIDIVNETVCIIESKAAQRGLKINVDYELPVPQTIVTDPIRLKQILLNLCGNAVKFTDKGSITVCLSYVGQTKQMKFSVSDTGIGMTSEQLAKVFSPFHQAEKSTSRFYGGTGLGLSISKQLAQRLGGDIDCHSEVGKGTMFTVLIHAGDQEPVQWINEPPARIEVSSSRTRQHTTPVLTGNVLLAEDSEDIQALIMMHLHKARLNARSVTNGVEAVREVSRWHFDLVLMDIQMPVMDGLTAIRQLRNQGVKTPIVALTASNTPEDKHQCLSSGADNFLVKPLDIDQFYALLSQYLSAQAPLAVPGNNEPSAQQSPTVGPQNMDQEMFDQEMQRLVQGFVSRLPQSVDEIATYYRRQQWHDLLTTSHRLKGAGGAFGFPELSELSRKIVDKVKRREYSELGELVESLRQRCRQITKKAG